jgi:hypothetical protein
VANVAVTFAVTAGGGQVTGASATTNASGVATAGGWTMGTLAGANTLTASASGVNGSPVTFGATANAGAPKTIAKVGGDNQAASPAGAVFVKPSVKVTDQYSNPVPGITVVFAVASGGGSVTGGTTTTAADGVATAGGWTLGPNEGANTLTATISGAVITGNPATFTATGRRPTGSNVVVNLATATPQMGPSMVASGTYAVQLRDSTTGAELGTVNFTASGEVGFFIQPPRIAWNGARGTWVIDLESAMVSGVPFDFTSFRLCVLLTQVDAQNPVMVEERDPVNVVVVARPVVSLLPCLDFVLNPLTKYIVLRLSGTSTLAMAGSFGGIGVPVSFHRPSR